MKNGTFRKTRKLLYSPSCSEYSYREEPTKITQQDIIDHVMSSWFLCVANQYGSGRAKLQTKIFLIYISLRGHDLWYRSQSDSWRLRCLCEMPTFQMVWRLLTDDVSGFDLSLIIWRNDKEFGWRGLILVEIMSTWSWDSTPQLQREEDEKIYVAVPVVTIWLIPSYSGTPCCFSHFRIKGHCRL